MNKLQEALMDVRWVIHIQDRSQLYKMDGKKDLWKIVYYPLFECGKTGEKYQEPRALVQNINKDGFWSKEVPLRYLQS